MMKLASWSFHNEFRYNHLFSAPKEELVRIDPIDDGTSEEWNPVKNEWRLIWILVHELLEDIEENHQNGKRENPTRDDNSDRSVR